MGKRGVNSFRRTDAIRALQSARAGGLEPTAMDVAIGVDGGVVFRIFTDMTMQPPSREVLSAAEWDAEIERPKDCRAP
jgi:hypothetical protein